jgi:hypothetical protein
MNPHPFQPSPLWFPIAFVTFWMGITIFLGYLSDWYVLMRAFPDQPAEPASYTLSGQWGEMGRGVNMKGILKLAVCASGIRVAVPRLFGPFSRPFLIPWGDLRVVREKRWYGDIAHLEAGTPKLGRITVLDEVATLLADASGERWPEGDRLRPGASRVTRAQIARGVARRWVLMTALASAFFILVPRIAFHAISPARPPAYPPLAAAVLFPAIVLGIACLFDYLSRARKIQK